MTVGDRDTGDGGPGTPQVGGLRPTYRRRVTADDVGERVSVRHLVDDPDRGPVPSDVVGRLAAADDEVLLIVDRHGQLHSVESARVLASKVVPPHPRREPEPTGGTPEQPLEREAARVLLLDPDDRTLLIAFEPEPGRRVWTTPGGGLAPGETHEDAARRELAEELGVTLELGPWVWWRRARFTFRGLTLEQTERWFLARIAALDPPDTPSGDAGTRGMRWWTLSELAATSEQLAPARFADELARLLRDGPPAEPVDVGY